MISIKSEAVILCNFLDKSLEPFTSSGKFKFELSVANRPLLAYSVANLHKNGFKDISIIYNDSTDLESALTNFVCYIVDSEKIDVNIKLYPFTSEKKSHEDMIDLIADLSSGFVFGSDTIFLIDDFITNCSLKSFFEGYKSSKTMISFLGTDQYAAGQSLRKINEKSRTFVVAYQDQSTSINITPAKAYPDLSQISYYKPLFIDYYPPIVYEGQRDKISLPFAILKNFEDLSVRHFTHEINVVAVASEAFDVMRKAPDGRVTQFMAHCNVFSKEKLIEFFDKKTISSISAFENFISMTSVNGKDLILPENNLPGTFNFCSFCIKNIKDFRSINFLIAVKNAFGAQFRADDNDLTLNKFSFKKAKDCAAHSLVGDALNPKTLNSSVLGSFVAIEKGSVVKDCVIGNNVSIGASCSITECVIGDCVDIPENVTLNKCVVLDGSSLSPGDSIVDEIKI